MKNTTINISFDEAKLTALKMYLEQKNMSVETELQASLNALYHRHVPSTVRDYVTMLNDGSPQPVVPGRGAKAEDASAAGATTNETGT